MLHETERSDVLCVLCGSCHPKRIVRRPVSSIPEQKCENAEDERDEKANDDASDGARAECGVGW